jgi:hypothetical protein
MKVYIRDKNKDIWHWELECPHYPESSEVERVYKKPSKGELCTLCKQIEAEGKNKTRSRDILGEDSLI